MKPQYLRLLKDLSAKNAKELRAYFAEDSHQQLFRLLKVTGRELLIAVLSLPLYLTPVHKQEPAMFNSAGMSFTVYQRRRKATLGAIVSAIATAIVYFSFTSFFLFYADIGRAATITWDGGGADNNWSTALNWSTDTVPTTGDDVVFDGSLGASSTKDVVFDVGVASNTIQSVTISSGYTGTVSLARTMIVTNDYSQADGTFTAGSSTLDINGDFTLTAGTFNASSATTSIELNVRPTGGTFNASGGTVLLDGNVSSTYLNLDSTNQWTLANLTINKTGSSGSDVLFEDANDDRVIVTGTLHLVDGALAYTDASEEVTIEAQGTIQHEATWSGGLGTIHFTGPASTIRLGENGAMPHFILASTSTIVEVSGSATTTFEALTIYAGDVRVTSSTADIEIDSALTVNGPSATFFALDWFTASTTDALSGGHIYFGSGTTTILDTVTMSPGDGSDIATTRIDASSSAYMSITLDLIMNTGTFYAPTGGDMLITDDLNMATDTVYYASAATTSIGGDLFVNEGTFSPGGGTVALVHGGPESVLYINTPSSNLELNNFTISTEGRLVQFVELSDRVVATGTLRLASGRLNGGNGRVEAQNGFIHEIDFNGTNGGVEITGPPRTLSLAPDSTFPTLILNSTGTILNAIGGNTTSIYQLTVLNGIFQANTSSITTNVHLYMSGSNSYFYGGTGNLTTGNGLYSLSGARVYTGDGNVQIGTALIVTLGTIDFSSSTNVTMIGTTSGAYAGLTASTTTAPTGVWEIRGGIHPNIGTFRFISGGSFDANSGTLRFAGAGDQHFNPSNNGITLHNLERISWSTSTFRINSVEATTLTGNLTLTGATTGTLDVVSGECVTGCAISTGTQAILTVLGTSTITNARVRDIDASAGSVVTAGTNVEDLGNNDGITGMFDNTPPTTPGDLTVSSRASSSVVMSFGAVTSSDANFRDYEIHYVLGSSGVTTTDPSITSSTDSNLADANYGGATSASITGLVTSSQYVVNIAAYDTYGNATFAASEVSFYTLPPDVTGVSSAVTRDTVTVSWSRDGVADTTSVTVSDINDGTRTSGAITDTSYTFTSLDSSQAYTFSLIATDANGETSNAVTESATTDNAGTTSPPPPPPVPGGGGESGGGGGNGPSTAAMSINGGAQTTQSSDVSLQLNVPTASQMAISNDPAFTGVAFEPYTSMVNWTLLPGLGDRVVYARFTSSDGGQLNANASITVVSADEGGTGGETTSPPPPTTEPPTEPGEEPSPPPETGETTPPGEGGESTEPPATGGETGGESGEQSSGGGSESSSGGETSGASGGAASSGESTPSGVSGQSNVYGGPVFVNVVPPGVVLSPVTSPAPSTPGEPAVTEPNVPVTPVQTTTTDIPVEEAETPAPTTTRFTIAAIPRVVSEAVESVQEAVQEVIDNPTVETVATNVANPVATVATVTFVAPSVASLVFPLLRYVFLQPLMFLGIRRRKEWGEVYNSLTKLPIGLAIVRLINPETNKIVESRVTDPDGRYVFLPQPGNYIIDVKKPGFVYPSRALAGAHADGKRIDLYDGSAFEIEETQPVIHPIPVDPEDLEPTSVKILSEAKKRTIQFVISGVGVVTTTASLIVSPTPFNAGILAFHIGTIALFSRVHREKSPKDAGAITDAATGKPVSQVIIRLYNSKYSKLIGRKVTGARGKFAFLAGPGEYYLKIDKAGYQSQRIPVTVTDNVKRGFVTTSVQLVPDETMGSESQNDQSSSDLSEDQDTPTPAQTASAPDQDLDQLRAQIDGPSS